MTAREMHYDYKQKLNKIDSQKYRNLLVPEIDWKLNEAQEIFVKVIAEPRIKNQLGFEINQRTTDDIRTIVVDQTKASGIVPTRYDDISFLASFPPDYWFLQAIRIYGSKGNCTDVLLSESQQSQHDDKVEDSPFNKSNFEWLTANYRFINQGLRVYTDGTFNITKVAISYIKRPRVIQNAQDFIGATYTGLDGVVYTGSQSSELPEGTHREIVDLAVLITAGDISLPDYQLKQNKIKLTT